MNRAFLLYFLSASSAALLNFVSRFAFESVVSYEFSIVLAYFTGMMLNFTLSKRYVFKQQDSGRTRVEMLKFFVVALSGLLVTFVVATVTLSFCTGLWAGSWSPSVLKTTSHLAGMAAAFVWNFSLHKWVSFQRTHLMSRLNINFLRKSRHCE